jgi:carbonic anhydrase
MTHLKSTVAVLVVLASVASSRAGDMTADEALHRLMEGNQRFVSEHFENANRSGTHRLDVAPEQHPMAVVLACSDSREAVEIIFDQGLGDLFVVRVAGNVVDDVVLGSIEYAVEHLDVKLVLVMGHETCGAVKATVAGAAVEGHVSSLTTAIAPALEGLDVDGAEGLDRAVRANVEYVVGKLRNSSSILAQAAQQGRIRIVGAYYDLHTGNVDVTH